MKRFASLFVLMVCPLSAWAEHEREITLRQIVAAEQKLARAYGDFYRDLSRLHKQLQNGNADAQLRAGIYGRVLDECHGGALDRQFAALNDGLRTVGNIDRYMDPRVLDHGEKIAESLRRMVAIAEGRDPEWTGGCRDQRSVLGDRADDVDEAKLLAQLSAIESEHRENFDKILEQEVESRLIEFFRIVNANGGLRSGRPTTSELLQGSFKK